MPSILPSNGDLDVLGPKFWKRLTGHRPCSDPDSPECRQKHEAAEREAEAELKRRHSEFLTRMEDEIAVMMRERENGH
jgi:hypothetical protein